ncbi:hypothetical protein GGF32_006502 [Allomyces javanicus]|nr:hypothetical protein GGF32_006502 [Allomyces javanicus]
MDRVLSLSARPKSFQDVVGQDKIVQALYQQVQCGRVPHFFLLYGSVGSGKTTLARLIAYMLNQCDRAGFMQSGIVDWSAYRKLDIREVNAANTNGVDDMRQLIQQLKYKPFDPSIAKIVILDEAHQLTTAAQNCLITETEDVPDHVFFIFCTSQESKIIKALERRAYIIRPKHFGEDDLANLIERVAKMAGYAGDTDPLVECLVLSQITSPGLALQSAEKYFNGYSAKESVYHCDDGQICPMTLSKCLVRGNWKDASGQIRRMSKSDIVPVRNVVLGHLRSILVTVDGDCAAKAAQAIKELYTSPLDDLTAHSAALFSVSALMKT